MLTILPIYDIIYKSVKEKNIVKNGKSVEVNISGKIIFNGDKI